MLLQEWYLSIKGELYIFCVGYLCASKWCLPAFENHVEGPTSNSSRTSQMNSIVVVWQLHALEGFSGRGKHVELYDFIEDEESDLHKVHWSKNCLVRAGWQTHMYKHLRQQRSVCGFHIFSSCLGVSWKLCLCEETSNSCPSACLANNNCVHRNYGDMWSSVSHESVW